jgi:hypothetical protein
MDDYERAEQNHDFLGMYKAREAQRVQYRGDGQRIAVGHTSMTGLTPVWACRITKRKDGREQITCKCGCCGFPHRVGSIEGCKGQP